MAGATSGRERVLCRQQDILARFGELALRWQDLDQILHEACRLMCEVLDTDFAKVMELNEDGSTLVVRAGVGWPAGVVGQARVEVGDGFGPGFALRAEQPVVSPDITTETRFRYVPFVREAGVRALVNVPIIGPEGEPPYGILEVDSRVPRAFDDDEVTFLRSYANLLAASVTRLHILTELRRSEDHYRASVMLNPQIPWTADPEGQVTGFSDRWLDFTGMSREAAMGGGWRRTPHPEDLPTMEAAWAGSVTTGRPYDVEARIRGVDGYRWLRVRASPRRDAAGGIVGWYGTTEDVQDRHDLEVMLRRLNESLEDRVAERTRALELEQCERQVAEEKLRQSQKMEAVGQLTGGLAHDFNNLLGGIIGSLELLQMRVSAGRSTDLERYITAAMTSANRAAALTHRLLAFARRQTLDPKLVMANGLVAGMEELLRRTVGPAIAVETTLPAGVGPILCDPNQLENAVLNLAINARDAMPQGGRLSIGTSNVVMNQAVATERDVPSGDYVAIMVTDTGTGMPADVVARAFDPFFTTKPLGEGTGLGLSMIYGFATQSGGQVHIQSREGIGTTVSIYLPRHHGEAEAAAHLSEAGLLLSRAGAGETVLVVDDEVPLRLVLVEVLQDLGYTVMEAGDALSGLRQAGEMPRLDLLVTDVGLPGLMNGRQLADAVRARRPELKVLFITGYAEAAVVGTGGLGPGMEIMTKPFTLDALISRIRELVAGG